MNDIKVVYVVLVKTYTFFEGEKSYVYKVCTNFDDALSYVEHFENKEDKRIELTYSIAASAYVGKEEKKRGVITTGTVEYTVSIEQIEISGRRQSNKDKAAEEEKEISAE